MKLNKYEIAELYKVSPRTIGNWMQRKVIPYMRIGNVVRFDSDEVARALGKYTVCRAGEKGGQV